MGNKFPFRKYGMVFENGLDTKKPLEPESPYESAPYVAPENREPSALEKEQAELAELRGLGPKSHWD